MVRRGHRAPVERLARLAAVAVTVLVAAPAPVRAHDGRPVAPHDLAGVPAPGPGAGTPAR
jgi:hypothetical protein